MLVMTSEGVIKISWQYSIHKRRRESRRAVTCILELPKKTITGFESCSSQDQFVKEIGRKKSLAAALMFAAFGPEDRKRIWHHYFHRNGKVFTDLKGKG